MKNTPGKISLSSENNGTTLNRRKFALGLISLLGSNCVFGSDGKEERGKKENEKVVNDFSEKNNKFFWNASHISYRCIGKFTKDKKNGHSYHSHDIYYFDFGSHLLITQEPKQERAEDMTVDELRRTGVMRYKPQEKSIFSLHKKSGEDIGAPIWAKMGFLALQTSPQKAQNPFVEILEPKDFSIKDVDTESLQKILNLAIKPKLKKTYKK